MNRGSEGGFAFRPLGPLVSLIFILALGFVLIQATDTDRVRDDVLVSQRGSPEEIAARLAAFREEFGLDRPLLERFGIWSWRAMRLDFGTAMTDPRPVRVIVGEAIARSALLQLPALFFMYVGGISLGVYLAVRRRSLGARIVDTLMLGIYATPTFWLATLLLVYLATDDGVPLFPLEGLGEAGDPLSRMRHLALPVTALTLPGMAVIARHTRSAMLEALGSPHVLAARAAGVPEGRVIRVHALMNALLPAVTLFGVLLPGVVGGSVVVEKIFNIDGMGLLLWKATMSRDFPLLQAILLTGTIATLCGFVLSDLASRRLVGTVEHG